ncbi:GspE/PulE family protein [Candidatus Margulisiibacteriota bacterium]
MMEARTSNTVAILNNLIEEACILKSSDIHIEPRENKINIRFRVDGILNSCSQLPKSIHSQLISRIKVISNLDISEQRVPQDGRTFIQLKDKELDTRISTIPTFWGEKAVIRILDRSSTALPLDTLGMDSEQFTLFRQELKRSQGIILVTGPTGSGKTTTLYSSINQINSEKKNITTIEDPVEYQLSGINQIQVNEKSGLTFSRGLRSMLRQDPDIIMIGEIRDRETAEIAIRAAMTGHLVLSTLHTNSAIDSINRLIDIGIEPYLLASSLNCIIAQRLVRKMNNESGNYEGRTGIFEILKIDEKLKDAIHDKAKASDLFKIARANGFKMFTECGQRLIKEKITTKEELMRILATNMEL